MQVPTAEELTALLSTQPADLPVGERIRQAVPVWFATWTPEYREAQLVRWRVIATTPVLRTRAAEFERTTAEMVTDALPTRGGGRPRPWWSTPICRRTPRGCSPGPTATASASSRN